MSRMTAHRTAALVTAAASPLLLGLWAAAPAQAHGAPTDPVSRVFACSPDGGDASGSTACRAAVAANGAPFTAWDNLRVANVNGRDRQRIPDGELCSGGLPAYKGLDLPRSDWPSTTLDPGGTLTMRYVSTIPHTGTFKLFLTRPGYDPTRPLTWSDLPEKPFAEVTDPALTDGAYRIRATLPSDRTGRQVLYTIWQNSSTPDTYYSCSDVVFPAAKRAGGTGGEGGSGQRASTSPSPTPSVEKSPARTGPSPTADRSPATRAEAGTHAGAGTHADAGAAPSGTPVASAGGADSGSSAPMLAGGAATVLLLTGGAALALRLRRR
ncbi:secreted cellulose-binding protein [Streptomyces lincolnensis]|uniref:Secreted cellulose-binding protein n=1 Tax=Streptomyces lincolnensis TaxID=1915 RepID=A0A1B1MJG8_STRLN|nr:lytic polysaccharide monooxygenase [Streptomyces lincolnensis]ANS68760.1 secreted cellulose-binding protein [Streptomyces lincolnensis]AXG53034.1 secreted cellulose-binding protein [Streptomyces lincolnensis]QMV10363.1 chitin-binding protein [Streptomyces lincolnensis]